MKKCKTCGEQKPYDEFYSNGYQKNGNRKYKPSCKICEYSSQMNRHYEIINEHYNGAKCVICGYNKDIRILELHHLDPLTKEKGISEMKTASKKRMIEELSKCVPLCPTCHRELHYDISSLPEHFHQL